MDNPIPVICELCRAEGQAGADPFAHLADLLSFTPVPRRAHANGWSPELQRAFVAALVVTGSPARAARAIGRHAFGAQQLRKARGGASFAAAWDAALDLARERELAGLREGLTELAAENEEQRHARRSALLRLPSPSGEGPGVGAMLDDRVTNRPDDPETAEARAREVDDARTRMRDRMMRARRLYLSAICDDPAARAAWEVLVGPADWDKARCFAPQPDEPADGEHVSMRRPDMLLTAEAGLIPDVVGGPDALASIREALELPSEKLPSLAGEGPKGGGLAATPQPEDEDFDPDALDANGEDFADRAMRQAMQVARDAHPEEFD